MYNWSTDETKMDAKQHAIWQLEQMVNFGLGGGKIKETNLRVYWSQLNLDPYRRKFFELLLKP